MSSTVLAGVACWLMELETTSHCDRCGMPLGIKCDRDYLGCAKALLFGIYVREESTLTKREYRFYCGKDCQNNES
jgi:hypothetical protein